MSEYPPIDGASDFRVYYNPLHTHHIDKNEVVNLNMRHDISFLDPKTEINTDNQKEESTYQVEVEVSVQVRVRVDVQLVERRYNRF